MNYYFLPGIGTFGGIKVGYQFADLLNELGARSVVVTPDGRAPDWFRARVPTLAEDAALPRITARDRVIFSLPHDHSRLRALPASLVFHCQGTDPLIDPVVADPAVTVLTCWPQATAYVRERTGHVSVDVGISVAEVFYYRGQPKQHGQLAHMPRRGAEWAAACQAHNPDVLFTAVQNATEVQVADLLQRSEYFLATSVNEWFGLPALEAMAAGCVVLSVPTVGGGDYLLDGVNSRVAAPAHLPTVLSELAHPDQTATRARLRDHARVTASRYRIRVQSKRMADLLAGELSWLLT